MEFIVNSTRCRMIRSSISTSMWIIHSICSILYFQDQNQIDVVRNEIQLFCNQMFVTDSVENIVPEFMTLLHGVIDSPDIPLNVSRSYLQSDANVKRFQVILPERWLIVLRKFPRIIRKNLRRNGIISNSLSSMA